MLNFKVATLTACISLLLGCANVTVKKIPNKSDYPSSGDNAFDQAAADAIEGNRYYLPRPYIAVGKEFPFESSTEYLHGVLSPDGKTVSIAKEQVDNKIAGFESIKGIPIEQLFVGSAGRSSISDQADLQGDNNDVTNGPGSDDASSAGVTPSNASYIAPLATVDTLATWDPSMKFTPIDKNSIVNLKFKIQQKSGMASVDNKTVRELFLMRIEQGKPVEASKYPLPIEFYEDDGKFEYKGLLPGLKKGLYVIGVNYYQQNGSACDAHPIIEDFNSQKIIKVTDGAQDVNYGSPFVDSSRGFESKLTYTSPVILTNKSRSIIDFSIDIPILNKAGAGDVSKVTSIALVPILADKSLAFDNAIKLPFESGADNATKWSYSVKTVMADKLAVGEYSLVVTFSTATTPAYVYSKAVLEVQNFKPNAAPKAVCELTTKVVPPPANPGTSAGTSGDQSSTSGKKSVASSDESKPQVVATTQVEEKEKSGGGMSSINATPNPDTKPVIDINDFFKLLYLPDFEQQYAVQSEANLSTSEVSLSLENGWMLENFKSKVDNRAIANFFFLQLGETLDLVRNIVRLDKKLLAPIVSPAEDKGDIDAQSANNDLPGMALNKVKPLPVLLKVHKIKYAVPGIYPILKPSELSGYGSGTAKSVINFNTRDEIIVELVKVGE